MNSRDVSLEEFAPQTFHFYRHALEILYGIRVPFLVGGAYAFCHYTGIARHTKDFDVFLRKEDVPAVLAAFQRARYRSEMVFSHWLAKVFHEEDFVDLIFSSGNAICPVDASWFTYGQRAAILGVDALLIPVEEMLWQKCYIMERERYDGADVIHLLRARGRHLDWDRLLRRFGEHWRVLLSHLVLFGFVYPDDRESIPPAILRLLSNRLHEEPASAATGQLCQGTLLSRKQYLADTESWGYADARLSPLGPMSDAEVLTWTDAGR